MTTPAGTYDIDLIADITEVLNGGLSPDGTLSGVVSVLEKRLGLSSVCVWWHDINGRRAIGVGSGGRRFTAPGLDGLPIVDPAVARYPIQHGGVRHGVLEMGLAPGQTVPSPVVRILNNVLAPFLDSLCLAEDLAFEVAIRSREISEQRRFTSLVIDNLPVGLYVVDREYRIQFWNRKRETGTQGLRRDHVVGRSVFDVLTGQPASDLKAEFDQVFTTGETVEVETLVQQNGEPRAYHLSRIPMRLNGDEITHVITVGEDVTEARRVEQQVRQRDKLAALGQLVAGVMHEINNPLATIAACAAAIDRRWPDTADEVVREYLEIIEKEVDRCTGIVDGLLSFARQTPGKDSRVPISVNPLVERTLFLLKHHKRFKKIAVEVDLIPGDMLVTANEEQLIQVLMALLFNGIDALDDGGRLVIRTRKATDRPEALIDVLDEGRGISPEALPKIFEPFYTTKAPGKGTGLGLSVAYGIMRDHGGRIEVVSELGRGSQFTVVLPMEAGTLR